MTQGGKSRPEHRTANARIFQQLDLIKPASEGKVFRFGWTMPRRATARGSGLNRLQTSRGDAESRFS